MKKLLSLLSFLCLVLALQAQEEDYNKWMRAEGTLQGFEVGAKYFTLVSDANLREQTNTQSKVITKLPIGTAVTVESVANDSFTLRGVKLPWIKVSCQPNGGATVTGYVWGGFMALASIQTPNDEYMPNRGVLFLTGVSAFSEEKHQITVQVRAALDGKELAKSEFVTTGDLSYYPEFELMLESFQNVKAVLSVNYFYPACGYPSGNNLLFWTENNQITKVLETSSVSDGGVFYDSEEFILPSNKGGIGDHIIVVNDHSEFEEKGNDLVRTVQKYKITLHKWTGSKLVKVKELK